MENTKINLLIEEYEKEFEDRFKLEDYKWIGIKQFQDNWDINAENFAEMLEKSIYKFNFIHIPTLNDPRGMIIEFARHYPNEIKDMFQILFDENKILSERLDYFKNKAEEIFKTWKNDGYGKEQDKNHYQGNSAASVYLWLKYPDKYNICKYTIIKSLIEILNLSNNLVFKRGDNNNIDVSIKLYEYIKSELLKHPNLVNKFKTIINSSEEYYKDNELTTLAMDIGHYIYDKNNISVQEYFIKKISGAGFDLKNYEKQSEWVVLKNEKRILVYVPFKNNKDLKLCLPLEFDKFITKMPENVTKDIPFGADGYTYPKEFPVRINFKNCKLNNVQEFLDDILMQLNIITSNNVTNKNLNEDKNMAVNIPLNQILYGPPGTGKTYNTAIKINDILINNKTIKNTKVTKEITSETPWWQAIALTLYTQGKNRKFKVTEIENLLADYIKLKNNNTVRNKLWEQLQKHTDFSSETVFAKDRNEPFVFDKTKDSEWYLTEKGINYIEDQLIDNIEQPSEDVEDNKFYNFITFHQSYSYEEFVEGIKPSTKNGQIEYKIENGIFKKMCIRANSDPDNNYVIVIDEINRGNISKIFGELITLIEEDKRIQPNGLNDYDDNTLIISESSKEKNSLTVTLPYSQEKFGVPKNLYILGTMNTSDRSIASVDIALRRRFVFKEMMPDSKLVSDFGCNFKKCFEVLNERISILLDRDHQIGHSYFINEKYANSDINTLENIWFDSIIPLLNEYFYGDWEKLQAILGEAKDDNTSFIKVKKVDKDSFAAKVDFCEDKSFDFNYNCNFASAMEKAFDNNFNGVTND